MSSFRFSLPASSAYLTIALASAFPGSLWAASAEQLPDIRHVVQAGDTLEGVAKRYLRDPQQWREIGELNGVKAPTRLPIGKVIVIPAGMVGYENVLVEYIHGPAMTRSSLAGSAWHALEAGATLTEGDELQVPAGSFVTLKFADNSLLRINEKSEIKLSEIRKNQRTNEQLSLLELDKGGIDARVIPAIEQRRKRKFEIKTRIATTSVRGTVFSVSVSESGSAITAVDTGTVAVNGRQNPRTETVHAGFGIAVQKNGQLGSVVSQLDAPQLKNGSVVFEDANFLTLELSTVAQARQYQVTLAKDEELTKVLRSQRFDTTTAIFQGVADGAYYVGVRSINAQGIPSKATVQAIRVKATPVAPLHSRPEPNTVIGTADGELVCTEGSTDLAGYRIQIAGNADFSQLVNDSGLLAHCKMSIDKLSAGNYFWRVASVRKLSSGELDQGPFSKPQAFSVGTSPEALHADALQPAETDSPNRLTLSWPAKPGQTFNLQLAQSDQFDPVLAAVHLDKPQWQSDVLLPGDYYVRLQVLDPSGLKSHFSAARKLSVDPVVLTSAGSALKSADGKFVRSPR